jgi:nuclear GTP-binding protein
MGGHKKGGGKGQRTNALRAKGGRNCHPDDRAAMTRSLEVPGDDLRRAGKKLEAKRAQRDEAINAIRAAKLQRAAARSGVSISAPVGSGSLSDRHKLAAMALQAVKSNREYTANALSSSTAAGGAAGGDLSLRKYSKEFKAVIEQSDVLLQILDARDPQGCRLYDFEQAIRSQYGDTKTIVMVLNKADMVPDHSIVEAWVAYFADMDIPAVPFSATSSNRHGKGFDRCVPEVFRLLRRIGRVDDTSSARKSLTVGVIGYPNVGKSSTINALRGKNVVGVGNMPGVTTGNTEVDLRKDIKIIDCPGVVVKGADGADVVLRNASKVADLEDPRIAVERALERADIATLCSVYSVPLPSAMGNPAAEFLRAVALKRGRVRSGGMLDLSDAARMVLKDWNDGRIQHYTMPPARDSFTIGAHAASVGDEPELLQTLSNAGPSTLPSIHVLAPQGAAPAGWEVPENVKHAGKIKHHPMDSSDDEQDPDGYLAVGGQGGHAAGDSDDEA